MYLLYRIIPFKILFKNIVLSYMHMNKYAKTNRSHILNILYLYQSIDGCDRKRARNIAHRLILIKEEFISAVYVLAFSPRDRHVYITQVVVQTPPTALSCLLQLLNVALSNRRRFTRHRRREDGNNRIGISISTYYVPLRAIHFQSSSTCRGGAFITRSTVLPVLCTFASK